MPTTDLTSSGQNATILDVLASERLITAQQMEEIKVKSASLNLLPTPEVEIEDRTSAI